MKKHSTNYGGEWGDNEIGSEPTWRLLLAVVALLIVFAVIWSHDWVKEKLSSLFEEY